MLRPLACSLALLILLVPGAAAVTVCLGTGELCVEATATPHGTTDADTATLSYETSSTIAPEANRQDSATCGVIVVSGSVSRAGAGCASLDSRQYAYVRDVSGPSPSTCVGLHAGGTDRICRAVGASSDCAGVWHGREAESDPMGQTTACDAPDYTGRCVVSSWLLVTVQCGGYRVYEHTCPNGDFGTQLSVFSNNDETELICVSTTSFASAAPPANVPAGLLP